MPLTALFTSVMLRELFGCVVGQTIRRTPFQLVFPLTFVVTCVRRFGWGKKREYAAQLMNGTVLEKRKKNEGKWVLCVLEVCYERVV